MIRRVLHHWEQIALVVISLTVLSWFHGRLLTFWDVVAPYSPRYQLTLASFSWFPFLNSGSVNFNFQGLPVILLYAGTSFLGGGNPVESEEIAWWLIFLLGALGAYALLAYYLRGYRFQGPAAFIGAVLYVVNPYAAFTDWSDSAPFGPLALGVLPWAILIVEWGTTGNQRRKNILMGLLFGAISPLLFVFAPLMIPVVLILVIVTLSNALNHGWSTARFVAVATPCTLAVNSYWWAPYIFLNDLGLLPINTTPISQVLGGVDYWSQLGPPWLTIRLLGEYNLYGNWWSFSNQFITADQPIVLALVALPLITFVPLLLPRARLSRPRLVALTLAFVGLVASYGTQAGLFGLEYQAFVASTGFARGVNYPQVSWEPLILLGYAVLLAFAIDDILRWSVRVPSLRYQSDPSRREARVIAALSRLRVLPRKPVAMVTVASITVLILVSGFPLLTGQPLTNTYNADVAVPAQVWNESSYLNQHAIGERVLLLPASINGLYGFNWSGGFLAYDPLDSLSSVNLLANFIPGESLENSLFEIPGGGLSPVLYSASNTSLQSYRDLLELNNVKYIVVRTDTHFYSGDTVNASWREMDFFLSSCNFLTQIKWNSSDTLYEVASPGQVVSSSPLLVSTWDVSPNLLETFALHDFQFSSQFPNGMGTVAYAGGQLFLNGTLNSTVPWTVFQNVIPLGIPLTGSGSIVLVGNFTPSEIVPLLGDNGTSFFVGGQETYVFNGESVSFLNFSEIDRLDSVLFTRVNGSVRLSGIYIGYNLSEPANLANISSFLDGPQTNSSTQQMPIFDYEPDRVLAGRLASMGSVSEALPESTWPSPSRFDAWNVTSLYEESNLSFGGSTPSNMTVINGTIHLSIVNSTPFDLLINQAPLDLPTASVRLILLYATNPVGVLLYNDTPPRNASFTSHNDIQISRGEEIEAVAFAPEIANIRHLGIQTQPFNSTDIVSILLLNASAQVPLNLQLNTTTYLAIRVTGEMSSPTDWQGNLSVASRGQFLVSFAQAFSTAWSFAVNVCANGSTNVIRVESHDSSLDGLNLYLLNATGPCQADFALVFQVQPTVEMFQAASGLTEAGILLATGLLVVIPIAWKRMKGM